MLPDLLPAEEEKEANIGVWGMRHKRYLKQNHKVLYYNLLTSGKLNSYLADIEQQAQQLFLRLVKELAEQENVTEELKATDMMLWVQKDEQYPQSCNGNCKCRYNLQGINTTTAGSNPCRFLLLKNS